MLSTNRVMLAIAWLLLFCTACTARAGDNDSVAEAPDAKPTFGVFTNPLPVTIIGYSQDAMEPFISPDGNYLFFNSSNSVPPTNLYYATRIDDLTFQFQGEIGGANMSGALTAVPSMDINNTFYFISNRSYAQTFSTIYSGTFSDGSLSNVALVPGVSKDKVGDVNFDQCISPDGGTLYFVDGVFTGGQQVPGAASIAIATRNGNQFTRLKNSAKIMRKINTHDLNYAPDVSKSGLEFFFTRIPKQGSQPKPPPVIYTATRSSTSKPFGKPRKIDAITGFAEAPALSPDEKSLYYHLQVNGTFVIYRLTRP
jgi:Tol biopolymer transport system component